MGSEGINELPAELVEPIARFMDAITMVRFSAACKGFYYLLEEKKKHAIKEYALSSIFRRILRWEGDTQGAYYAYSIVDMAVRDNDVAAMRAFLKAGVDPNEHLGDFRMLSKAVHYERLDVALVLMEYGANPSLLDRDSLWHQGRTPLGRAIYDWSQCPNKPLDAMVFPLIRAGVKIIRVDEFNNLVFSSYCFTALKFAVEHGSDLSDLKSDDGKSCDSQLFAIIYTIYNVDDTWWEHLQMLKWFILQYPELLNVLCKDHSALTYTLEIGWLDFIPRLLLKHGIRLGVKNIETGLDELETAREEWPELVPFIERRLELDSQRQNEVIDGLLPHDLVPWD